MTILERYGWRGDESRGIGRVIRSHGDYYHLVCNESETPVIARKKKSAFRDGQILPLTGDFVKFVHNAQGESMITAVLPRFSHFERRDPAARREVQTLAVNFDALFVMMSLNENFSIPRIERYIVLAEDREGGELFVVLTKSDLSSDGMDAKIEELENVVDGRAKILKISSLTGEGLSAIREIASPQKTVAFIGSSGVGKSTLLNTLAGEIVADTCEIQEWSGKGRHATTSRELHMLPNGAMVIDTPGIREIGMIGENDYLHAKGVFTHRWRS